MIYRKPEKVISPQDAIQDIQVIHDGGDSGVSVAKLLWNDSEVIAIRWNVAMREWDEPAKLNLTKECLGMPVSNAHPVWFVLPNDLFDADTELHKVFQELIQEKNHAKRADG